MNSSLILVGMVLERGSPSKQRALKSPIRMEILGLFAGEAALSISDMAERMGRRPTSLYHHVAVMEAASLLVQQGSRRKGRRDEALYRPLVDQVELELDGDDPESAADLRKIVRTALRMTERDFSDAVTRDDLVKEGPHRNLLALRLHMRASEEVLAQINHHIDAILEFLQTHAATNPDPEPTDQHLSLTLALLPLRGRNRTPHTGGTA